MSSESAGSSTLLAILVLLVLAVLLAVTNPSVDTHRRAIADEYKAQRPLAGAVGLGTLTAQLPEYHSAVVASYTSAGDEITSIGVLGMVFVVDIGTD